MPPPPLPPATLQDHLDARTYRRLLSHLRSRSDAVQNIDMMITAGFCRNCLAKWRHAAAWDEDLRSSVVGRTYEDALRDVYGEPYGEWKRKHQASVGRERLEELERAKASGLHAEHDAAREGPVVAHEPGNDGESECCKVPLGPVSASSTSSASTMTTTTTTTTTTLADVKARVLTLSDRASRGEYADESGPRVRAALERAGATVVGGVEVLPDEEDAIVRTLEAYTHASEGQPEVDVVLTTGGTGLGRRDVTPEATLRVVRRRVPGIAELLRRETSKLEPLAVLSRGEAGTRGRTLIVNLPGSPAAVEQCMGVLVPLLPRVLSLLRDGGGGGGGGEPSETRARHS